VLHEAQQVTTHGVVARKLQTLARRVEIVEGKVAKSHQAPGQVGAERRIER
jgi:hypothetical protein